MPDIIDRAQHYDEQYREQAISGHFARHAGRSIPPPVVWCADCGEEIPAARRQAVPAATRCIECQERHERIYGRSI